MSNAIKKNLTTRKEYAKRIRGFLAKAAAAKIAHGPSKARVTGKHPTSLYRQFNNEGKLLYVGISLSHLQRLGCHKANAHWFNRISRVEIEHFPSWAEAKTAEDRAIIEEKPECNIPTASQKRAHPKT
jgi:hypothetical protein